MTRARITTQGRDWTTTSNAPGVILHRLNQYPLAKSSEPIWKSVAVCLGGFALIVAAVML